MLAPLVLLRLWLAFWTPPVGSLLTIYVLLIVTFLLRVMKVEIDLIMCGARLSTMRVSMLFLLTLYVILARPVLVVVFHL